MLLLQKYRLSLKREQESQDAIQKTITRDSTGSSMASNQQAPFNLQGFLQFSNQQSPVTSYQLDSSCSDISNPLYGQLMEPSNQLDSTRPNSGHVGIWITSNDLAGFGQTGNSNGEEILRGDTDPFSVDSIGFGNATHCLKLLSDSLQQQFMQPQLLPPPPPPPEPEEHDILGVERGEIDEWFDTAKNDPTSLFHDEEFIDLW
jgi:hypothetical protein